MEKSAHEKVAMKKNKPYIVVCDKLVTAHRARNLCSCADVVINLIGGKIVWTRVEFECGERIKINCHCLEIPQG